MVMADDSLRNAAKTARALLLYTVRLVLLKLAQFRASRSYEGKGDVSGSIRRCSKWISEVFAKFFVGFCQPSSGEAANVLSRSGNDYPGNEREIRLQSFAAGPAVDSSTAFPRDQKGAKR